jgi:hypothetical protein
MRIYLLLIVVCFASDCNKSYAQATDTTKCYVLIFNDSKAINVYSTYRKGKVIHHLVDDTLNEDYFSIRIIESKNNLYRIMATSVRYPGIEGWIMLNNIGINTRNRNGQIALYDHPAYDSASILLNDDNDEMVRVIDVYKNWLKIRLKYNGSIYEKWLPYNYQCSNPYSTCN